MNKNYLDKIKNGATSLGIEFGSTRIKSVLIDDDFNVLSTGSFSWENQLVNKLWTYSLEDALKGLRESYKDLKLKVSSEYGVILSKIGSIGISGMMHGYIALDQEDKQLYPFLTWRNTNTEQAASILTDTFRFNIPLRWTIAQLYQAILNKEEHVGQLGYVCTLASYIHYRLTGKRVVGIGEASGMFPIDSNTCDYEEKMLVAFSELVGDRYSWSLRGIFPKVLTAGENAGLLTEEGALLIDPDGDLSSGIPMVAPEGDAGTGMVATNSVTPLTGNVSAGTSIFAMVVLDKGLSRLYKDIDMVTTPAGKPVAMVHCNNGTSEIDKWFRFLKEFLDAMGISRDSSDIYKAIFNSSLSGAPDCRNVIYYNYLSGEPVTGLMEGCPMLLRRSDSPFSFADFARSQLYSVLASLSIGCQIFQDENVNIKRLTGHGGYFKIPGVGQKYLSAAMKAPVTVLENAGEGGPYGMAILASFLRLGNEMSLHEFLEKKVFANSSATTYSATEAEIEGYSEYLEEYKRYLDAERKAVEISQNI